MAEQTKAQKKRAEARERRRGQPPEDQSRENQDDGALAGNEEQPLDAVVHLLGWQGNVDQSLQQGLGDTHGATLDREDALHPPAHHVRKRQQPQRFAGRGGVDDDGVEVAGLAVAVDPQQVGQLVHAGQHGELVRHEVVDLARPAQDGVEPFLNVAPVGFEVVVDVGFLRPQVGSDLLWHRSQRHVQAVGQ